jgi:voltage-gated potassium channel Kch
MLGNLQQYYPTVPVLTAVKYLAERTELHDAGATQAIALMPEGTLGFGLFVLERLGVESGKAAAIIGALRASDYAALRGDHAQGSSSALPS